MPVSGIRLFRVLGITVFLHWTWLMVAAWQLSSNSHHYDSRLFDVLQYLGLFGIVLLHEFGHALACRSVGGRAEQIVLWPLGGVAYVSPPPRPGAVLWSIAAGPLVNVALLAAFAPFCHVHAGGSLGFYYSPALDGDVGQLLARLALINVVLLVFNMLPIYPLDGGQILQSLLWFVMGRVRSLQVSTVIGGVGAIAFAGLALYAHDWMLGLIALFAASRCWAGWKHAAMLKQSGDQAGNGRGFGVVVARRPNFACPACRSHPPVGPYWACPACHARVDKFDDPFACPSCGRADQIVPCPDCRAEPPYYAWRSPPMPVAAVQGELVDG